MQAQVPLPDPRCLTRTLDLKDVQQAYLALRLVYGCRAWPQQLRVTIDSGDLEPIAVILSAASCG